MKQVCLILCILTSFTCYSQKEVTAYLELKGYTFITGDVEMQLPQIPEKSENLADSLIDYKAVISVFARKHNSSIKVINALSSQGWILFSTVYVEKAGMILYYFKRTFTLGTAQ